eukprot:GFUD01059077.1.p1 GENE.GFUD01059077.1~~GFUD01059077.1.p1  ORF type:complete len:354 (-),score=94.10 GFUD01059077.1:4-1065(-)
MSASRPGYESALAKVFEEKEKSRRKLGQLWQENSRLDEQVKGKKEESARLEVLARGNREELEQLQLLVKVNREELIEATEENEKLDKELETAVRKRGEPSLASDEKKRLEARIAQIRDRIAEGERNLADHEEELAKMNSHGVARELYEAKKKDVEGYKEMHRVSMDRMSAYIDSKQARLQEIASDEVQKHAVGALGWVGTSAAHASDVPAIGGMTQSSTSSSSRKHHSRDDGDEVLFVPKVIKTEEEVEESYPGYSCPHCPCQLTSAATLVSHLVKYFPADDVFHCPFPGCPFWSEFEGLTRHFRSIHTSEMLFHCSMCSFELPSYSSLVDHERKHYPPWWTMRGSTILPGGP